MGDPTGVPVSPVVGRTETDDIPARWSFITPAKTRLFKEITGISIVSILIALILIISLPYGILSSPGAQLTSHGSQMNNIYKEVPDGSAVFLINVSKNLPANSYILTENTTYAYMHDFEMCINIFAES